MKLVLSLFLSLLFFPVFIGSAQEKFVMKFAEQFTESEVDASPIVRPMLSKVNRLQNNASGKFIIEAVDLPDSIKIIADEIDATGIISGYDSHTFHIQKSSPDIMIEDACWEYSLRTNNGADTLVMVQNNSTPFTIAPIDDENLYGININGDIYGTIIFSCKINGRKVKDSFRLSLELRPHIKSVTITKKEMNTPNSSYNVYYSVEYVGARQLLISVEEEYGTGKKLQNVYQPYFANIVSDHITAPYYAWIDIEAENKYGKDVYTLTLPPYKGFPYKPNDPLDLTINQRPYPNDFVFSDSFFYDQVVISDNMGVPISSSTDDSNINNFSPGFYIIDYYKDGVLVKSIKRFKQ